MEHIEMCINILIAWIGLSTTVAIGAFAYLQKTKTSRHECISTKETLKELIEMMRDDLNRNMESMQTDLRDMRRMLLTDMKSRGRSRSDNDD